MSATGTKVSDTGRVAYTASKRTSYLGIYNVIASVVYPNSNYVHVATPLVAFVSLTLRAKTSATKISAHTYTRSGAGVDCSFFFTVHVI